MRKKRIFHLITGLDIGGTENQLLKILPRLQNDFDNRVCTLLGDGPIGKKLREADIKTYHLNLSLRNILRSIIEFRKIIKEFQPDILVTYLIHSDLFGRIFGRLFGVKKIICSQRGSLMQWEWLRFFDKITKFLVTKYIVQTEIAKKKLLKKLNLSKEKIKVIPNAINLDEYNFEINKKKKEAELGIKPDNINIVCVSKLRKGKGHVFLLTAFEKTYEIYNNINLLIVGGGELKNTLLKQLVNYNSINNIYFLGERDDIKEILKISDIFVLATEAEGMSNAILEAMAAGLPVITTDIIENRELIKDNQTGIMIPVNKSDEIAKSLQQLINNPELARRIGNSAKKELFLNYDINKISNKLNQFFTSL